MSDSIWNDPRITAYALGELPEDERKAFESELESNGELAAAVAEARSLTGQLEELFADEPMPALDGDRRDQIIGGANGQQNSATVATAPKRSWKVPALALATAASLLLLVGGPFMLNRQQEWKVGQQQQDAYWASPSDESTVAATAQAQQLRSYGEDTAPEEFREAFEANREAAGQQVDAVPGVITGRARKNATGTQEVRRSRIPSLEYSGGESDDLATAVSPAPTQESADGLPQIKLRQQTDNFRALDPAADTPIEPTQRHELQLEARHDLAASEGLGRAKTEAVVNEAVARNELFRESLQDKDRSFSADQPASPDGEIRFGARLESQLGRGNLGEAQRRSRARFGDEDALLNQTRIERDLVPLMVDKSRMEAEYGKDHPSVVSLSRQIDGLRKELKSVAKTQSDRIEALQDIERESLGIGPGQAGDQYDPITDNPFKRVAEHAISTFSVDVDTASYSKSRDFLMRTNQLPPPGAVRIEELVNYFDYDYQPPTADDAHPFTAHTVVTACPWNAEHRLARIALKGKVIESDQRPRCNLVFLLDTSGSMNQPNKLPLVVDGMKMLLKQLNEKDQVAITVYAGSAGLVLDSTPAKKKKKIRRALTQLSAGGSTNGGAGIALAYQTARDNFISGGVNRVILCTDGDFNVGTTGTDALVRMVEQEAKGGIFLSVLGFGMGNHNDAMLEQISGRGNGNYAFIDNENEAQKVLVEQTNATLVTIAKDVKLQIEFNPLQVSAYRLIGYENRVLAKEDFNDDSKDAGEIGAGHAVTALYEIVPVGVEADETAPKVDALAFQTERQPTEEAKEGDMMKLKLRYKQPEGNTSALVEFPVKNDSVPFTSADQDVRFAAAVAGFGMQLRRSEYKGNWTLSDVRQVAESALGEDPHSLRAEFVELVNKASELMGEE